MRCSGLLPPPARAVGECPHVLLTISTTHRPATDLGYLLHKNPAAVQAFELPFGGAQVFYPEAAKDRCTATLLLDVGRVGLVRGSGGPAVRRRPMPGRPRTPSLMAISH